MDTINLILIILEKMNNNVYYDIKMIHDYLINNIEYETTIAKSNIYDIYGKEVPIEKIENVDNLFLVCKVNKNLSVLINNLKDYGKFNLSIGR